MWQIDRSKQNANDAANKHTNRLTLFGFLQLLGFCLFNRTRREHTQTDSHAHGTTEQQRTEQEIIFIFFREFCFRKTFPCLFIYLLAVFPSL